MDGLLAVVHEVCEDVRVAALRARNIARRLALAQALVQELNDLAAGAASQPP